MKKTRVNKAGAPTPVFYSTYNLITHNKRHPCMQYLPPDNTWRVPVRSYRQAKGIQTSKRLF